MKEVASCSFVLIIFSMLDDLGSRATVGLWQPQLVEVASPSPLSLHSWYFGRTRIGTTSALKRPRVYDVASPSPILIIFGVLDKLGSRATTGGGSG